MEVATTIDQSRGLMEMWALWRSGIQVQTLHLWGYPVLWWGRAGKILQLIAGLLVVVEIVGMARLTMAANRVRRALAVFRGTLSQEGISSLLNIGFLGGFCFLAVAAVFSGIPLLGDAGNSVSLLFARIMPPVVADFVTGVLAGTFLFLGWAILAGLYYYSLRLAAFVLGIGALERWVKAIALVFFSVGFYFDLLAS